MLGKVILETTSIISFSLVAELVQFKFTESFTTQSVGVSISCWTTSNQKMSGYKQSKSQTLTMDSDVIHESKDDWTIDESSNNLPFDTISAPSFIRLFVINRIIRQYIVDNIDDDSNRCETTAIIDKLASIFKNEKLDNDKDESQKVFDILYRLITDGIKTYMNKWYNEKEQAMIIEMIFNKIILVKFAQEYNKLIKYNGKNKYENLLFNSTDLMTHIFQYLRFYTNLNGDLFGCSLVNSHWLYHSWNVNSVYYVSLEKLIEQTYKYGYKNDHENNILRMWQRIMNVKDIYFRYYSWDEYKVTELVLNRLLMIKNVRNVNIHLFVDDIDAKGSCNFDVLIEKLRNAVSKWKEIEECSLSILYMSTKESIANDDKNVTLLSPLKLLNARYIQIGDVNFYREWSQKCEKLSLTSGGRIKFDKNWCDFVIKHCDCSGVKFLELAYVGFDDKCVNDFLLKQLVSKFSNVKKLDLDMLEYCVSIVLLLKYMTPVIKANKGNIELEFAEYFVDWDKMIEMWDKHHLNVDMCKLYLGGGETSFDHEEEDAWRGAIRFMNNINQQKSSNAYGLTQLGIIRGDNWQNILHHVSYESINILRFGDASNTDMTLSNINDFLQWPLANINNTKNQVFIVIESEYLQNEDYKDKDKWLSKFEQLFEYIIELFNKQMPFDIRVKTDKFEKIQQEEKNKFESVYLKNSKLASGKYKAPKCNMMVCTPRIQPEIDFGFKEYEVDGQQFYLSASNAQHVKF